MEAEGGFNGLGDATQDDMANVRVTRPSLLSLLVEAGVAPEQELRAAAAAGVGGGERLGEIVLRNGWLDEVGLGQLLAQQWSLPFVSDSAAVADRCRDEVFPLAQAEALGGCLIVVEDGSPCVAVAEPATARLDALRGVLGADAGFAIVTPTTLERLLAERRPLVEQSLPVGDADLSALLADLAAATGRLTAFREHIAALTAGKQAAEQELELSRRRVAELEQGLAAERGRSTSLRGKLAALVDELDG